MPYAHVHQNNTASDEYPECRRDPDNGNMQLREAGAPSSEASPRSACASSYRLRALRGFVGFRRGLGFNLRGFRVYVGFRGV